MFNCAMTAAANAHELEEERDELEWERAEEEYVNCLHNPVVRYRVNGEWTSEDGLRLDRVLGVLLRFNFRVLYDPFLPVTNDTDMVLTGVDEPVYEFACKAIIETLCNRSYDETQAQTDYNNYLGELGND